MTLSQFLAAQLPPLIDPPGADWVEAVAQQFKTTPAAVSRAIKTTGPAVSIAPQSRRPDLPPVGRPVVEPTRTPDAQHPFDRVLSALQARGSRIRPNRDRHGRESVRAQCPAHDDRVASLIVTRDGDKALLMCWAGCPPKHKRGAERVERIADALGLKASDLFSGHARSTVSRRIVATYDYQAIDGTLLGQKVRYAPKGFRWRSHSSDVGLYHLPDLIDTRTVFLTEGEKGCDRLWAMGLAATCGPAGVSRWMTEWSRDLWTIGCRDLVILPDNDQAGRDHAERVAADVHSLNVAEPIVVKLVTLPGLAPKADVVDWLDAGHDGDELVGIAADTPAWSPGLTEQQRLARRRQLTLERVRR